MTWNMRIPQRRSQKFQIREENDYLITPDKLARLKRELEDLEKNQRPKIVEDLVFAREQGDLSENAEYQDAKAKLGRIDSRIFSLKERIKNAQVIEYGSDSSGKVRIGSTVTVMSNDKTRTYQIVGTQESDPSRGMISYRSPLGEALLGHAVGETVVLNRDGQSLAYRITEVA
jgi:transcription elongation factor GreA